MAEDGSKRVGRPSPQQTTVSPLDFMGVVSPALQVGSLTGTSGLLFGAVSGVLRSTTPTLFALASGLQWFTLGSTFWATRTLLLHELRASTGDSTPPRQIASSALAGGVSGGIGGLLRSQRNVIPGALIFSALGGLGQAVYNYADAKESAKVGDEGGGGGEGKGWLNSKWSPVKALSDEEYGRILEERLLRVNAEIAILDESIAAVAKDATRTKDETATGGKK